MSAERPVKRAIKMPKGRMTSIVNPGLFVAVILEAGLDQGWDPPAV